MWRHCFFSHVSHFQIVRYLGGFSSFLYVFRSFTSFNFALFFGSLHPRQDLSLCQPLLASFNIRPSRILKNSPLRRLPSVWLSLLEKKPYISQSSQQEVHGRGSQSGSAGTEQMPDLASDRIACAQWSTITTVEKLRRELYSPPQAVISSFDNPYSLGK